MKTIGKVRVRLKYVTCGHTANSEDNVWCQPHQFRRMFAQGIGVTSAPALVNFLMFTAIDPA